MAVKLKTGRTYTPSIQESMGVDMTNGNYYGVIDRVDYDKQYKQCNFSVDVFGTETSRNNEGTVVDRINFSFSDDVFDSDIGSNGLTISNAYVNALATLADWESDE
jgi:hypothetical protein